MSSTLVQQLNATAGLSNVLLQQRARTDKHAPVPRVPEGTGTKTSCVTGKYLVSCFRVGCKSIKSSRYM